MEIKIEKHWSELGIKARVAIVLAIMSFFIGWLLTYMSFIVPPLGKIEEEVLWALGQALLFTGSVLGLTSYVSLEVKKIRKDLFEFIERNDKGDEKEY